MLFVLGFIFPVTANAGGLSTGFSEVILVDLQINKTYSTQKTAGLPLTVVNTGQEATDLKIEVLLPQPQELKPGFEPIPDISWIRLEKSDFKQVKPNEAAQSDVLIAIPNKPQYRGKNYQVFIWTHTVGRSIGIGLKSRLLLKIKADAG